MSKNCNFSSSEISLLYFLAENGATISSKFPAKSKNRLMKYFSFVHNLYPLGITSTPKIYGPNPFFFFLTSFWNTVYRQQPPPLLYSINIWPALNARLTQHETNHYIARCASLLAWSYLAERSPEQLFIDLFSLYCPYTYFSISSVKLIFYITILLAVDIYFFHIFNVLSKLLKFWKSFVLYRI